MPVAKPAGSRSASKMGQNRSKLTGIPGERQARGPAAPQHLGSIWGKGRARAPGLAASPPAGRSGLLRDQPLEQLDLLRKRIVVARKSLDLANRVKHRRMVPAAETPTDLGQ